MPEHSIQSVTPRLMDAQDGSMALQSQHRSLPVIERSMSTRLHQQQRLSIESSSTSTESHCYITEESSWPPQSLPHLRFKFIRNTGALTTETLRLLDKLSAPPFTQTFDVLEKKYLSTVFALVSYCIYVLFSCKCAIKLSDSVSILTLYKRMI